MDSPQKKNGASHVQSVERALMILDLIAKENREMSLTEISKALGWPKSTVHGLIATLRDYHYISQSATTGHYHLGVRLFELGNIVARSWDIRTMALPVMQHLNSQLGEMIQLAMEDNGEVLYLEKLDSTHMMRIVSDPGIRLPMHCSALGKVLLAYKNPSEVKYITTKQGMPAMTSRTITSLPDLEKELAKVRRQGYAMDDREIMEGLRCIAAPIYNSEGKVRYAISVSGFVNSMQGDHLEKALAILLDSTLKISYEMGYRPQNTQ